MKYGPGEAGSAPAQARVEKGRERPADRAGEPGNQGDSGDGSAGFPPVEAGEGGEGGIVEAQSHAHAEHRPGRGKADKALREREYDQPGREHEIGEDQNAAAAAVVNRTTDSRAEKRRHQQRSGKDPEHQRSREAEPFGDRFGKDRRKVVARSPR